jgi:hypothetical protein
MIFVVWDLYIPVLKDPTLSQVYNFSIIIHRGYAAERACPEAGNQAAG